MKLRAVSSLILGLMMAGCGKQTTPPPPSGANTSPASPVAVSPTEPVTPEPTPAVAPTPTPAPVQATGPIGDPLANTGNNLSDSQRTAVRVLDLASINQAIQMFYVEEDRYPKNLNELIEKKYFARLPAPPRGMEYEYNPNNGQLRIVEQ